MLESLIPPTAVRVERHTARCVNQKIAAESARSAAACRSAGRSAVRRRLGELDREWDIERTLEANAASVALAGLALGRFVDRRWYLLPTAAAGFLLQHAVQGWCPPLAWFRRLGVRTAREIDRERRALEGRPSR